jgi:DNA-binding FadR family transcriptional regulator
MALAKGEPGLVSVRVAREILSRIGAGAFRVGDRLPSEGELARAFGVSRPSIREALSALQFAGYLESRRGSGTVVIAAAHPPAPLPDGAAGRRGGARRAAELLEARLAVEPAAACLAAQRPGREAALAEARTLLDGMWLALEVPEAFGADTDLNLHAAVARLCPNPRLRSTALALIEEARDAPWTSAREAAWNDVGVLEAWAIQHEAVLAAVAVGDGQRAATASRHHLRSVVEHALRTGGVPASNRRRLEALLAAAGPGEPASSRPRSSS